MSDDATHSIEPVPGRMLRERQAGRLGRLILKELREILRDRRTIITLVVMPLLIYPLLAVAFQRFLFTSLLVHETPSYVIGVESELDQKSLASQMYQGEAAMSDQERTVDNVGREAALSGSGPEAEIAKSLLAKRSDEDGGPSVSIVIYPDDDLSRLVADSSLHVAVVRRREQSPGNDKGTRTPQVWELIYRAGSPPSEAALHFVEARLQAYNKVGLDKELRRLGVAVAMPAATERHPVGYAGAPNFSLAALIPLILVLMTVTGAVYPAIDLTAGERERGTLETLIAAPVPRLGLLLAKYVAVLTVALLTAIINLVGMAVTAHSSGLAASLFGASMSFGVIIKVLFLLALFAAFFSAILLALTSCARSFKEAQAYIIPLMLLCLVPGVLCLIPSLEFAGWMAVTPLVNIVMLARDVLEGTVQTGLSIAAICSTVFYIAAAIALAARIFGTDAILYGSQATWSDLVRRPDEPQPAASMAAAMLGLALMFPAYFILANDLARSPELSMQTRLQVCAIITVAVFAGIPLGIATIGRVNWATGLGFRWPRWGALVGGVLLGASLWPTAHEIFLLSEWLKLTSLSNGKIAAAEAILNQFKSVPLGVILTTLALVPAVCEELCFRGFVFGALRTRLTGLWTVVLSAVLFGVFHEVLSGGRLLPSTFIGLALGFVRLRSGSVLPGMLLHVIHNCLLLTMSFYRESLVGSGFDLTNESHLPITWHVVAAMGVAVGLAMLIISTRCKEYEELPACAQ